MPTFKPSAKQGHFVRNGSGTTKGVFNFTKTHLNLSYHRMQTDGNLSSFAQTEVWQCLGKAGWIEDSGNKTVYAQRLMGYTKTSKALSSVSSFNFALCTGRWKFGCSRLCDAMQPKWCKLEIWHHLCDPCQVALSILSRLFQACECTILLMLVAEKWMSGW